MVNKLVFKSSLWNIETLEYLRFLLSILLGNRLAVFWQLFTLYETNPPMIRKVRFGKMCSWNLYCMAQQPLCHSVVWLTVYRETIASKTQNGLTLSIVVSETTKWNWNNFITDAKRRPCGDETGKGLQVSCEGDLSHEHFLFVWFSC